MVTIGVMTGDGASSKEGGCMVVEMVGVAMPIGASTSSGALWPCSCMIDAACEVVGIVACNGSGCGDSADSADSGICCCVSMASGEEETFLPNSACSVDDGSIGGGGEGERGAVEEDESDAADEVDGGKAVEPVCDFDSSSCSYV